MNELWRYEERVAALHSETVPVIRRIVNGKPFDIAATNGRTRLWAERFHEIEPEFLDWCTRLGSTDVLWDLGASIGHFGIYAALQAGCRVFAFEPEAQNFGQCALNHYLNEHARELMTPLNFGVADTSSLRDLHIRLYGAGEHTKSLERRDGTYRVPVVLLAVTQVLELGVPEPTAVKVDVDGAEELVFQALQPLWPGVQNVFMELPVATRASWSERFQRLGLKETAAFPVARMRGGSYDDIVNVTFARDA